MTIDGFVLALLLAAAALALWLHLRFPDRGPGGMPASLAHVALALVAGSLLVPAARPAALSLGPALGPPVLAVGVMLPPLVYLILGMIWVMRALTRRLAGAR
jgi:hypothetical protein